MMHIRRWNVALVCLTILACGRSDTGAVESGRDYHHRNRVRRRCDPPAAGAHLGRQDGADQIFEPLAEIGDGLNTAGDVGFTPVLARQWSWSADSGSIAFSLDPNAKWQDGRPVRAQDVKFSFALLTDPAVGANVASSLSHVDSISASDSLTAVAWFKRRSPDQFFNLVYNLRVMPEHGLGLCRAISWPRQVRPQIRWEVTIPLREMATQMPPLSEADPTAWRGRPSLDRVIVSVSTIRRQPRTRVLAGEADYIEVLRGDANRAHPKHTHVHRGHLPRLQPRFIQWNLRDPTNERARIRSWRSRGTACAGDGRGPGHLVASVLETLGIVIRGRCDRAIFR